MDGASVDVANVTYSIIDDLPLTWATLVQESVGSANCFFTPADDFNGTVSFKYTVSDGISDSKPATVTINLQEINDAPVAKNVSVKGTEDQVTTGRLEATDIDGDSLTFELSSSIPTTQGTLELVDTKTGEFRFRPAKDYFGTVSFGFLAKDASVSSNPATVEIDVAPVNDAPLSADLSVVVGYNGKIASGKVSILDVDSSESDVSVSIVGGGVNGTARVNGKQIE